MSTQVDRLEGLLDRVRTNRARPRGRIDETVEFGTARHAAAAPAPAPPEAVTMPGHASPAPRVERPTPIEMAVEDVLPDAAASAEQATGQATGQVTGQVIAAPTPAQPSRPIAEVATQHQPSVFLDVLARSLALRPR